MTISIAPARNEYTANAAQTIFNYTFKIFESTDLNVYITPSGQDADDSTDLTTAYTVTGLGEEDGGTIILSAGTSLNDLVTIVSDVPSSRTTDYQNNGDFRPDTVNADFDRVVSIAKKIEDTANRTVLLQQSQQDPKPLTLPAPTASKFIRWKADETGFENTDPAEISPEIIDKKDIAVTVENVSGMKNLDLSPGQQVATSGYYQYSDGGGAIYTISSAGSVDGFGDHELSNGNTARLNIEGATNVKQFGCKAIGLSFDDWPAFQAAINHTQLYGAGNVILSNGTNDTAFGGAVYAPAGWYSFSETLVIEPIAEEQLTQGLQYAGLRIFGDSITSTVFDGSQFAVAAPVILARGAWVELDHFQVKDSLDHGIRIEVSGKSAWNCKIYDVFVNNPAGDGVYFGKSFLGSLVDCLVYNAGGWAFSWNDYHTSWTIKGNYSWSCTNGGYFVGDRVTPANSLGMTYSSFSNNACDGGSLAYTLNGCRAVTLTGCGCEVISGDAIFISGSDSNVSIEGFLGDKVGGHGVYSEGNRVKVTVNNYTDSRPTDLNAKLFRIASADGYLSLSQIKNERTGGLYQADSTALVDVNTSQFIFNRQILAATSSGTVCNITHANEIGVNINGMITVNAIGGTARSDTVAKQEASYILAVSISAAGKSVAVAAEAGGVAAGADVLPAFDWSIDGSNNLVATHKNAPIAGDRNFTFVFEPSNNIRCTTPV